MVDMICVYQYVTLLPSIACLLASVTFLCYLWFTIIRPRDGKPSSLPFPEVSGAWPIIGHLPKLVGSTPLFKILADMSDKNGPAFMVRFGMHPTLVVSSWEMTKECFSTNDRFLANRPHTAASKYLNVGDFAFSSYGPYWREIRKIASMQLFSLKRLESLRHIPYSEISNHIKVLYECCQVRDGGVGVEVNMTEAFKELTLNVALKLVVGKSLFNQHGCDDYNEEEEEEGKKLHKTIKEFFSLLGVPVASDIFPFLGWLDVDGKKKRMKRVANEMNLFATKWMEEHKQQKRLQMTADSNKENDFMDVLISVLDEDNEDLFAVHSRDTVIKSTCLSLVLGSTQTTSVALTWALSELLNNPSVLRKAKEEIDTKVGKDRNIEDSDIKDLVYLHTIVKETLRLHPPGPLSIPHEAIEDCIVNGYEVKAGTRVFVNLWKMHRDPRVWSDPLMFKPERFLPQLDGGVGGEAAHVDFRGQHFEYLPFGSGRRMCPAFNSATQLLHMALARLVHAFDFDIDGLVIDMTEGPGLSLRKLIPLKAHLRPRLPTTFY